LATDGPPTPDHVGQATSSSSGLVADGPPTPDHAGAATSSAVGLATDGPPTPDHVGQATSSSPGLVADGPPTPDRNGQTTSVCLETSTFYGSLRSTPTCSTISQFIKKISPLPKASASRVRKRKAESAEMLTSSPYKDVLMMKEKDKKDKEEDKKKKAVERKKKAEERCKEKELKKKKKQTVRKDKPRGRKPKQYVSPTAVSVFCQPTPKHARRMPRKQSMDIDNSDNCCTACGELFSEATSDWLQCRSCHSWYELECAGMLGKSKAVQNKFVCELCGD